MSVERCPELRGKFAVSVGYYFDGYAVFINDMLEEKHGSNLG